MTKSMTSGKPVKLILLFALPLIVGNIFQQFYSMADTFIVGRTIGVDALAAVGCTGSITFLIIGFAQGFTSGLSIRVAQRYGAGDEEGVRRGIACGALLSLAATVILTVVSCAFTRTILVAMNTPAEILEQAYDYLIVIFAGTGTTMLFNYVSNISRALGDSRTPWSFWWWPCIINIFLDYFLILNVGMNVEGAAYATIAAQLLSGVACLVYMLRAVPADAPAWIGLETHLGFGLPCSGTVPAHGLPDVGYRPGSDRRPVCPQRPGLGLCSSLHCLPEDR